MKKIFSLILAVLLFGFLATPAWANDEEVDALIYESTPSSTSESTPSGGFLQKISSSTSSAEVKFSSLGLPEPWILPDSPFYFLISWYEKIRLFLTFNPEAKAEFTLKLAENRLAEAYKLAEKGQVELSKAALEEYQKIIDGLGGDIEQIALQDKDVLALVRRLETTVVKEQKITQYIEEKFSGEAQDILESIKNLSAQNLEKALKVVGKLGVATPSYELQEKVLNILKDETLKEDLKNKIQKILEEDFDLVDQATSASDIKE